MRRVLVARPCNARLTVDKLVDKVINKVIHINLVDKTGLDWARSRARTVAIILPNPRVLLPYSSNEAMEY